MCRVSISRGLVEGQLCNFSPFSVSGIRQVAWCLVRSPWSHRNWFFGHCQHERSRFQGDLRDGIPSRMQQANILTQRTCPRAVLTFRTVYNLERWLVRFEILASLYFEACKSFIIICFSYYIYFFLLL